MNLLHALVLLFSALLNQEVIGDCNVYNTIQSSRCHQVQDCVNAAFFSDRKNLYVHDKVFRSTEPKSPIALIVNCHVTIFENNNVSINHNDDGSGKETLNLSGSGSNSVTIYTNTGSADESNWKTTEAEADNIKPSGIISYGEELGWSATGIYNITRPVILVALQPAFYWWTLAFAIDNYSFPSSIHLHFNTVSTDECESLKNITRTEVKEALQHFIMNLNYNTTGKTAYLWNTDTNQLQPAEKLLMIIILSLAISVVLLLTAILPKLNYYGSKFNWDSGGLGMLLGTLMLTETLFHFLFIVEFNDALYSSIRGILTYAIPSTAIFGGIYGIITSCCYGNWCGRIATNAANFAFTYMSATCFAVYTLPVVIEAFNYPIEIISTIEFIVIGIAGISAGYSISKWFISRDSKKSTSKFKNMRMKFCYFLQMAVISACIYVAVPIAIYTLLVLYLILLKQRVETPESQIFQILLPIITTASVTLGSFLIKKKLQPKKRSDSSEDNTEHNNSDSSDDETNHVRRRRQENRGYQRLDEQTDQQENSTNTREQSQPEGRQLRRRDRQQRTQESSSQEMQVLTQSAEIEQHQDNTDISML